ncbi:MAG: ATP-binding protein [Bacillota bacterium]|nr:ATP-binding protein [Bacillota bacterium]
MNTINMPPFAPVLMESTRAMGYSLEAAVADIIDNSIAAKADTVQIQFSPYTAVPYVSILDNGIGMNQKEINDAMRYGSQSSLNERDSNDLGRFGLGLKTASLSQCRCLTVISKQDQIVEARRWDLDEIYKQESWALISLDPEDLLIIPQYQEQLKPLKHGTLVIWENLDRMLKGTATPDKLMNKQMDYVRDHLALVFHRYLAGEAGITKLRLTINGLAVEPKDPFLIGRSTVFQADERFNIEGHPVYVSAFMLPHVSALTKKEKAALGGTEGLTKDQGFYVYRNKRLLVWGTWFRMHRKDELSKLARIRVDVPNALDHLWTLDIRKSTAVPPDVIKKNLSRIVARISEGSKRAWTFRGKREVSDDGSHLWSKTKIRDGVVYNLNREHLLLKLLSETLDSEQKKLLENYLRLAEGNLPLNQLYVDLNNEEQVNVRKEKDAETEAMETAMTILANIAGDPARDMQIQLMMQTDPFCNYRKIVDMLAKELGNG